MIEMSDHEYERSGLRHLTWFVLGVPFSLAARRGTPAAWAVALPAALLYELVAVPLVVGSILAVVVLTSPMMIIASVMRLRRTG